MPQRLGDADIAHTFALRRKLRKRWAVVNSAA
jgi:hypothetical protein